MASLIDWYAGDIDTAFAEARRRGQPLLLYWGASWCPPCNRIKGGLFVEPDFVAATGRLLPFALDGDAPGAQQLAARFHLRSYPTLVLFNSEGGEITRLPNEPDAETGTKLLTLALAATSTAQQSLAAALSASRPLSDAEWRLLSFYSWDTDEDRLLAGRDLGAILAELARLCPSHDGATRFGLHALALAAPITGADADDVSPAAALLAVLGDARLAAENTDILVNSGSALIAAASAPLSVLRSKLLAALDGAAQQWQDNIWLGLPDRMAALRLRVRLQRLGLSLGMENAGLLTSLREHIKAFDAEADDPFVRHSLINIAAGALSDAGLPDEADALLMAQLPRSHSPYYFMQLLAANAGRRGDTASMLDWYGQAWRAAKGPATRIQWGATYLLKLLELAPADIARIEEAACGMLADVQATPNAFCQRNRSHLRRIAQQLAVFSGPGPKLAALKRAIDLA